MVNKLFVASTTRNKMPPEKRPGVGWDSLKFSLHSLVSLIMLSHQAFVLGFIRNYNPSLIFEWFYWLLYVTWYNFSGQLSRSNPRPSRYLPCNCSVEEKHSQHKNFNQFSFVLFSMEGNPTCVVIKSSDGDIKKLMASAVPESTKGH